MKISPASIFLIGMPGSGKTTIGRGLARTLTLPFVDLDQQIEERCGVKIPIIFEIEGEQGFRKRETQVLEEVTGQPNIVLATGGGAVLAEANRRLLAQRGLVVYLRASIDELYRRTSRDRNRPLLATPNPKAKIKELMKARGALYEEIADLVIDTGAIGITTVVQQLVDKIECFRKKAHE